MTLTSIVMIISKRECCRYLSGESYESSYSKSLMFSNNKAVEQVKFVNAIQSNFSMIFIDVIWLPGKI